MVAGYAKSVTLDGKHGAMKREKPLLPALSAARYDDAREVRADSVTSQLRALAKQQQYNNKARKRSQPVQLEPLASTHNNAAGLERTAVQKQIQGPISLQWLVDDFVHAAGTGDVAKVDHYIRGGIPIDMKHSVLQQTALHASTVLRSDSVTRHLVQAGADVNALTKDGESALHLAARYHSAAVAEEVLRNRADLLVVNKHDMLAMEVAADIQDHKMEQLLEPPPNAPSNVRTSTITSTSITVEWSSHGIAASRYEYRVSWVLSGSLGEFFEVCSGSSFRVNNLMPASQYEVRVQAGNHTVGWSNPSDLLIVETDGDVPNAMAAPFIAIVTDHSISMRIRLPPSNGADLQRVSIQLQCAGSLSAVSTSSFRKLLKSAEQDQRWESMLCDVASMRNAEDSEGPHDKEHVVDGLLQGHVYYFRVKASNRFGWSPDGEVSDGICTNDTPKIIDITSRSMTLVWTKPYSTELIDVYQVQARVSYSTKWEVVATDVLEQSAQIDGLIPATAYSFRVVPHYFSKWEEAESCAHTELTSTHVTVPEAPVRLRVVDRAAHSVTLTWEMPRCNGHAVESYELARRRDGDANWSVVGSEIPVDTDVYTVSGLQRGTAYQFRIRARNLLGSGPYEPLLNALVWTYAFLPPTAPVCVAKTSFSLTIQWRDGVAPDDDKDDEQNGKPQADLLYEVQMCQLDLSTLHWQDLTETIATSGTWRTVCDGLTVHDAVVSGLMPLGCYCFRVRAQASSSAVSGDASSVYSTISAVFQTLRRM